VSANRRYRIQSDKFEGCPALEQPLMSVLASMQQDLATGVAGVARLRALPQVDLLVASNTPGTDPWPLRLTQLAGAPLGALLLAVENLTTPGSAGVPTSAVTITSQHVEAGTIFVDLITGLTIGQRYRLRLGVLDAN